MGDVGVPVQTVPVQAVSVQAVSVPVSDIENVGSVKDQAGCPGTHHALLLQGE